MKLVKWNPERLRVLLKVTQDRDCNPDLLSTPQHAASLFHHLGSSIPLEKEWGCDSNPKIRTQYVCSACARHLGICLSYMFSFSPGKPKSREAKTFDSVLQTKKLRHRTVICPKSHSKWLIKLEFKLRSPLIRPRFTILCYHLPQMWWEHPMTLTSSLGFVAS